jgi:outer membrane protein OmpA-like peptidoglycan-associated protein
MKTIKILAIILFTISFSQGANAQFWKKLAKHAAKKVEKEGERRVERRVDRSIDKAYDETEDEIDGKNKKTKKAKAKKREKIEENNEDAIEKKQKLSKKAHQPKVIWNRFDFVPGDTVIFEDAPSPDEENGEFPSRWDLYKGGAEIAEVDGKPVITFITAVGNMHSKGIVPYLKDPEQDYLPDVFTIEFDAFFLPKVYNNRYYITFYDRKNQKYFDNAQADIFVNSIEFVDSEGKLKDKNRGNWDTEGGWRHISIAFTKGKFKMYLEDQRLINIPHFKGNPTGVTLSAGFEGNYIKNFRIAKGGVKYYKRVLSEGKIIVNGIKFDINKATLKPESMGPINRINKLMKKQPKLKFSVEGHTDSDGDAKTNMKLSKARAKTVMNKLIAMGISKSRLKYTGFGESKPIDNNATPEGKANNRRVEFVKY